MQLNNTNMSGSIPLGDWGSLDLSSGTVEKISGGVSSVVPSWISDILFPKKVEAVATAPKLDPKVIGAVAAGGVLLLVVLMMGKKKRRAAPRALPARRPAPRRRVVRKR